MVSSELLSYEDSKICKTFSFKSKPTGSISRTTEPILYSLECSFHADSKYGNKNINFEQFWKNKFEILLTVACIRHLRETF